MTDRSIIFSSPMVRALISGSKTQTRRILKPKKGVTIADFERGEPHASGIGYWMRIGREMVQEPRFVIGDRLWVRENFARVPITAYRMSDGVQQTANPNDPDEAAIYAAGWERSKPSWKPSIHMPRWASRLTLIVESVKVERLQDISEEDARAEGVEGVGRLWLSYDKLAPYEENARDSFGSLWKSLHGADSWDANPWVAAVAFRVIKANIVTIEKEAA